MATVTNRAFGTIILTLAISGCANPGFDVPTDAHGAPTLETIVQRITCEVADMMRQGSPLREYLSTGGYHMSANLTLKVTDSGSLSPSVEFLPTAVLTISAAGKLAQSRSREVYVNFDFSLADVKASVDQNPNFGECPQSKMHLTGDLGIADTVALVKTAANRDIGASGPNGEFGGTVTFGLTRSAGAFGPTWKLTRFSGPGPLIDLSRENTDTLSFAFAQGDTGRGESSGTARARAYLRDVLARQIKSEIETLNNRLN